MGNIRKITSVTLFCLPWLAAPAEVTAAEVTFVNNSVAEELDWYMIQDGMDYYLCSSSPGGGSCSHPFSAGRVDLVAENWDGDVVCDVWKAYMIKEGERANVLRYPDDCQ